MPTAELESPAASSASAKSALDAPPSSGARVLCAVSSDSTWCRPLRKKVLAAITSIATLIRPAIVIATRTSIQVKRISRFACASSAVRIRSCISAEWSQITCGITVAPRMPTASSTESLPWKPGTTAW